MRATRGVQRFLLIGVASRLHAKAIAKAILVLHVANSRIRGDALRFYSFFAMSAATKKHTNAARKVSACTSLPGR